MSETTNGKGWEAGIGAALGAIVGESGLLGGGMNRNQPAGVTPDQLQTAISGLQSTVQGDALTASVAALSAQVAGINGRVDNSLATVTAALGGAIGGVKDTVVAGNQAAALASCATNNMMQQGFASVTNTVVAEGAATRSRIDQLEIGNLRDKIAERDLALAKSHNDSGHRETQVLIQNTANASAVAQANSCCNPCNGGSSAGVAQLNTTVTQMGQLLVALHADVARIRSNVAP